VSLRTLAFEYSIILAVIVLTDYVSLLFVRRFLVLARTYPISASLISSIIGLFVVTGSYTVVILMIEVEIPYWLNPTLVERFGPRIGDIFNLSVVDLLLPLFFLFMRPAFIIHLWMPLFALSLLVARLMFWIFRAVEWAQWFLKQGDAHPLKAIGIVATIIVFGSAMVVKEAWTVL
jgi:hypothetical protein